MLHVGCTGESSHLDANYGRDPDQGHAVQPGAYIDACPCNRSTYRLLYLAAVRDERLSGPLFHDGQIGELRRAREPVGHFVGGQRDPELLLVFAVVAHVRMNAQSAAEGLTSRPHGPASVAASQACLDG